ncbi:MAG: BLUF domain-containing protein [Hyphomicrobiaceae bacterium]
MLVRCLYASRATELMATTELDRILEKSRRNNLACGITGLLCYRNGVFVQVLEGGRERVSALLCALYSDTRHTALQLLLLDEINERHFGSWNMGKVSIDAVNDAVLLKYSEKAELDPFSVSGHSTLALLIELASAGSIANRP